MKITEISKIYVLPGGRRQEAGGRQNFHLQQHQLLKLPKNELCLLHSIRTMDHQLWQGSHHSWFISNKQQGYSERELKLTLVNWRIALDFGVTFAYGHETKGGVSEPIRTIPREIWDCIGSANIQT